LDILSKAFRGELGTNNPEEESTSEPLKEIHQEQIKTSKRKSGQIARIFSVKITK
jgi:hypothetical protein